MDRSAPKRTPRSSAKKRTSEVAKMECATNRESDQTAADQPSDGYPASGLPTALLSSSSYADGSPVEAGDVHGGLVPVVVQDVADPRCVAQLDQTIVDQPSHEYPGSYLLADKVPSGVPTTLVSSSCYAGGAPAKDADVHGCHFPVVVDVVADPTCVVQVLAVLPTALVSSSSYAVSKNWINRKSREYYASHKEGIKKRRQELYADRRKTLEGANMESNTSMPDTARQQESIPTRNIHKYPSSARQIGERTNGETSNAHSSSYERENEDFQQNVSTQHATNLYIDDNLIKKVIGSLRKKEQAGGDLGEYVCSSMLPTDDRTIVLPKRRPCPHCRAYKFYKETDRFCCGAGEIAIAG